MDDAHDGSEVDQSVPADDEEVTRDWLLSALVGMANNDPTFESSMTLTVPGGFVSGRLVSAEKFYTDAQRDYAGQSVAGIYAAMQRAYGEDDLANSTSQPAFIHLKGAHLISGASALPHSGGFYWRGRISQVTGWCIGELSSKD